MSVASPLTVAGAFERATRWFGDREAVVDSATRLTYRVLEEQSRRAGHMLIQLGVRPGEPVAILAVPSTIYIAVWLGTVRIGAIPIALHVRESAAALAGACEQLRPVTLAYDASLEPAAEEVMERVSGLRRSMRFRSAVSPVRGPASRPTADFDRDTTVPGPLPVHEATEDDTAAIVLSSGTTSAAKGVMHSNRSLIEMARTDLYLYGGIRPTDRSLVPLSTAFIGCYNGWLPFLNAGACAVFMERFDLDPVARIMAEEKTTHVFLTPTLWRRFLSRPHAGADFSSLRQIGFAAEMMDAETLANLRERVCSNVVQMYGSTETGAAATCNFAEDMIGERLTSVGRPMPNGDIRVVRPDHGPTDEVEPGEIGEVLVSSPSLATGIWNDPVATGRSFVGDGERRWWRSRDLGRIDDAGFLHIAGRHDDMIISAGINVMPAKVEEALLAHPAVVECAVVGVPHPDLGEQIQAFVVSADPTLDAEALERHVLASGLSSYQRPRTYAFVPDLPRTPTNKVNRRLIRERASSHRKEIHE